MNLHLWLACFAAAWLIALLPDAGAVLSVRRRLSCGVRGLQTGLVVMMLVAGGAAAAASQDAAPSAGYGIKLRNKILPNLTYPETKRISGNPSADVEVRASPDGTITGRTLVKSSGVPSWDAAVLRAIDRAETLPRDVDGRVPSPIIISFTPR